jgi:hypothetical protein
MPSKSCWTSITHSKDLVGQFSNHMTRIFRNDVHTITHFNISSHAKRPSLHFEQLGIIVSLEFNCFIPFFIMATLPHLLLDATINQSPLRNTTSQAANSLPAAKETKTHPTGLESKPNASIFFVGTATTILEWEGIRLMTDPNFLHAGDHVHLGPGVSGTRRTNPALDLNELPRIDVVLLSHYHGDHFDQDVEAQLRRNLPIITTPHAKSHLANKGEGEAFTEVWELDAWKSMMIDINSPEKGKEKVPAIKVTGMPGKHVSGTIEVLNDFIKAVSLSRFLLA